MNKAYIEVIEKIETLIKEKKYLQADFIVNDELLQAYIPKDVEEKLLEYKKDIKYYLSENIKAKEIDDEKILNMLKGNDKSQLNAANYLCDKDLNDYLDEIKDYLSKSPCSEAASLIINTIAEQEISDEFIYIKNGVEYIFYGDQVTPVQDSDGFKKALDLLNEYLGNDYPYLLELTRPALAHEAYTLLPLSIEEDEAEVIVLNIIKDISMIIDDGKSYNEIKELALKT